MVTGTLVVGLLVTPSVNQLVHHDSQVVSQSTTVTVKAVTNQAKTTVAVQPKPTIKSTQKNSYSVSKLTSTRQCRSIVTQARPIQVQRRAQVVVAVVRVTGQPAKLGPAVKN